MTSVVSAMAAPANSQVTAIDRNSKFRFMVFPPCYRVLMIDAWREAMATMRRRLACVNRPGDGQRV
ncbi:MAG: hypothetical protein ACREB3_01725, partial [Burkholderiales bacterium]